MTKQTGRYLPLPNASMLGRKITDIIFARRSSAYGGVSHIFELDPHKNLVGRYYRKLDLRFTNEKNTRRGKVESKVAQ